MSKATHDFWDTDSSNTEVPTKRELWQPLADAVGGFDLDPAAGCEPEQIAAERYTPEDDGLTSPWFGTVWLNPPFDEKEKWYRRAVNQYNAGNVDRVIALAPGDASTQWFQNWFSRADVIGFLNNRDWFIAERDREPFATHVAVWNPTPEVVDWLQRNGTVVEPIADDAQRKLDV